MSDLLSLLPDELRARYFEKELADLDRRLRVEKRKSDIGRLYSPMLDLQELSRSKVRVPLGMPGRKK